MHEIKLDDLKDARLLTQAVLQITQMLGMYQAELARILGLQCNDIGEMASARQVLSPDSPAWRRARQFVVLYERLYRHFAGDGVAIYHWLRTEQAQLAASPFLAMVDAGRLDDVVGCFESGPMRNLHDDGKTRP
ncbi:MAG: hypothetical protein GC149_11920 [Gammaproteobacteria bacterium]|nr:hypothetical protein [Gammaproteobacteria bacterium]